ncbi:discoidin domain-containing receptor tyrosine kinase B-like isoform X2 [Anthonomus grandis grandis]|uniref:discoidin domain-containing receptor tyrosine kinase B-like isoform X2 n=1 Tax=Anthonomus grandis grandis TaxID=2921223 RepID=UPI002166B88F|nr:discoidin domain-containing receptor tyrosine kinase B-like isoform X2 [Anthonomus grandis grandis]
MAVLRSILLSVLIGATYATDNGQCRSALGMEEGRIPDHAISASSSYEAKSVGPQNARIRQEKNGGAWCPKAQISSDIKEYLEVDLQRNHLMTWTETQGRFGNGQGQEYAEAFLVEYWRSSLGQWVTYKDSRGEKVLTGNSNTYLVVRQRLELPFVASKVRFIPYSEHPRTVCMRVELYGCPWEQSLIRYDAPRGEIKEPDVDLEDISYDGLLEGRDMRGGLGQLVDGLYGDDDYQKQLNGEQSGSRWVGWSNEFRNGEPLEITIEFDGLREFNAVHLHTNNMFTRGVQLFGKAEIWFSLDGIRYQPDPVITTIEPDRTHEAARNVTIALKGKPARFIKLRLYFSDQWILLSEMSFESLLLANNLTVDDLEKYYLLPEDPVSTTVPKGETTHARKEVTPATSPTSIGQAYIGLITGVMAMVILLVVCTVFLMVRRGKKKVALLHKHTALVSSSTKPTTINMKDLKTLSTPIINNGLSRSRVSVKSKSGTLTPGDGTVLKQKKCNLYGHVNGEESDSENSSVYHEPYKLLPNGKQEYGCLLKKDVITSSKSADYADFTGPNGFPEDLKFSSPSFYNLTPPPPPTSRPPTYDQNFQIPNGTPNGVIHSENYYAATDIIKGERREQHFTPGRFTPIKLPEGPPLEGVAHLLDFPRHRLRLLEKLGEGDFGMVHLCEAEGLPDFNGGSSFHKKQLVIVKSLWRGCGDAKRHEFLRETSWLAGLRDANLARVVGLCSQDEPMCALLEHAEGNELPKFLAPKVTFEDGNPVAPTVSYGSLIYVATQIASGMKYLESLDLVHRDLAARNCVIDKNYTVKVSDHAMYCDRYESEYYISDTKARLPLRWMSWEALLLGRQTTKSDVWSFAVTLWEILMLCTQQPYAELTSEQVVENSNHWYQNDGCQRYLPRPPLCPREIYDLMGECWKRNGPDRPRFSEIHLFLQRKNLGFNPNVV